MVVPLLLGAMLAGLATSGTANLYSQWNQRKLYRKELSAYENLDKGYRTYLSRHGRSINPDRAWTSYYGQAERARNNITNSYAGSIGTVGGTVGAGAGFGRGLFSGGKTSRWL